MPDFPWLSALVLLVASLVQGFLGFGFGIVAMAGLTLLQDLLHAAGVVNVTGIVLSGWLLLRLRREVLWNVIGRMSPAAVAGVAVGVTALRLLDRVLMVRALGATIVAIALWNLVAPRTREHETPVGDVIAGLAGGVLGGAFNTGGPPIVAHLYRRGETPDALKATVQAVFLTIALSRLPLASAQGLMDAAIFRDAALAAPLVVLGSMVGVALARRVPTERFRLAAWVAFGLLGAMLFASA